MDHGSLIKDQDHGSKIMDQGSRIKDQPSRILDLGPCFGMNGHFRRDPDVISRPPESTIDFQSFYIGFTSLSKVKMVVLDENLSFVNFLSKN